MQDSTEKQSNKSSRRWTLSKGISTTPTQQPSEKDNHELFQSSPLLDSPNPKGSNPDSPPCDFSSPSKLSTEVTLDFDAAPGTVSASAVASTGQSQVIALYPRQQQHSFHWKAPHELGNHSIQQKQQTTLPRAPTIKRSSVVSLRTKQVLKGCQTKAASNAAAKNTKRILSQQQQHLTTTTNDNHLQIDDEQGDSTIPNQVCTMAFRGFEVTVATHSNMARILCSRTRILLQTISLPSDIIAMAFHSVNCHLVLVTNLGLLYIYHPVPANPRNHAFGRYYWKQCNTTTTNLKPIFDTVPNFSSKLFLSCSFYQVLVGHGNQMAVFDYGGQLLWTTQLELPLGTCRISGDGRAIALVLSGEGIENENPFGARIFMRDDFDGEDRDITTSNNADDDDEHLNSTKDAVANAGIVYKPGPFLVHSAAVSFLSFRGYGHKTSEVDKPIEEGNDLLLTFSDDDNSVAIFSQNSWKKLMQWNTPPQTRADWVRGLSALNIGDLDDDRPSALRSPGSRRPSLSQSTSSLDNASAGFANPMIRPVPSSAAGAWIAEITFRSVFPALRLSRLSYMKQDQPAHLESVAAILPAASIIADSILAHPMGLSVQGIWPAWSNQHHNTANSNADLMMAMPSSHFLSSSVTMNGTHSPPSELRLVASHPRGGNVIVMDFPLWGDQELGGMELGSPLRYLLSLSEIRPPSTPTMTCHIDYESNKLCAHLEQDAKSVAVTWRKQGSLSLLPANDNDNDDDSVNSNDSHHYKHDLFANAKDSSLQVFDDVSVVPVPLSVPSMRLPTTMEDETILAFRWWPDENYGSPPQLLCATTKGSLLLYEMPPPWFAQEPTMPSYDPFSAATSMTDASVPFPGEDDMDDDDDLSLEQNSEYQVMVTPHYEFGIGLRLEAQLDGMPAIAGSFKKHPLNGEALPAERTGMIVLGDELMAVNGVSLEGLSFDDIIATVRQVGADAPLASPISMVFRPVVQNRIRANSSAFSERRSYSKRNLSSKNSTSSGGLVVDIIGGGSTSYHSPPPPSQSSLVAAEMQQEFGRIIAIVPTAITLFNIDDDAQLRFLVLPWNHQVTTSTSPDLRGRALVVTACGSTLVAQQLTVAADCNPELATCRELGSTIFNTDHDEIESISSIKTSSRDGWCVLVAMTNGKSQLVFIDLIKGGTKVAFRTFSVAVPSGKDILVRSFSIQLLVTATQNTLSVFESMPDAQLSPVTQINDKDNNKKKSHFYKKTSISLDECLGKDETVVDLEIVSSGYLDAFPWIVVFTKRSAIVYRRPGGQQVWRPLLKLDYAEPCGNNPPTVEYPHLIPALRALVEHHDERYHLRTDWHPDSLLSYICSDQEGAKHALMNDVRGIYEWLSKTIDFDNAADISGNTNARLRITPVSATTNPSVQSENDGESAANLLMSSSRAFGKDQDSEEKKLLKQLSNVLCPSQTMTEKNGKSVLRDNVFVLPTPLNQLNRDEIRILWAMGQMLLSPPQFKNLDVSGQFCVFCISLAHFLMEAKHDEEPEEKLVKRRRGESKSSSTGTSAHFVRNQASRTGMSPHKKGPDPQIATVGCIAALLSDNQTSLLEACRSTRGEKLTWQEARILRLPFWIRSDEILKQLSKEIGMTIFQQTRDIMECALFFVISGNKQTLRNLALTDQSLTGRKFLKFINSHDFSSERGRKAAEKNAYSLLRKNKHNMAATFFMLAEPPLLKTALEIILSKSQDLDLAFMVVRLMECTAGGGGNPMGSLGGFSMAPSVGETKYADWTPKLGKLGEWMLRERGLPLADGKPCLEMLQHMWLGQSEKGAGALCGFGSKKPFDSLFPTCFDMKLADEDSSSKNHLLFHAAPPTAAESANVRVLQKTNTVLDFVARPFLIKQMGQSARSRWASTLLISNAMLERGIELAASRYLIQNSSSFDLTKDESRHSADNFHCTTPKQAGARPMTSSIFDDFTIAPRANPQGGETSVSLKMRPKTDDSASNNSGQMNSSIFDDFNAAPPKQHGMESSIFDSFDAPPKATKPTNEMKSSIFDRYDVASPKTQSPIFDKYAVAPPAGEMKSSIFDSFDTAPPKPKEQQANPGGNMTSSIFDSFDTAPPKKAVTQPSGEMKSSIFDNFDTAPPKTSSSQQNGEMASSIFDSFDTAPQRATKTKSPGKAKSNPPQRNSEAKKKENEREEVKLVSLPIPTLWSEWRRSILSIAAARRLIREVNFHVAKFFGDAVDEPIKLFRRHIHPLISSAGAETLRCHCEGEALLNATKSCLSDVCTWCGLEKDLVVANALRLLEIDLQPPRIVLSALLLSIVDRADLAEDIIRDASICLMERCEAASLANDDLIHNRETKYHDASQYLRRYVMRDSWQLELCLWLHRGGVLPLSVLELREATTAVRAGFVLASWGRDHECLETMIRCEPDCPMDHDAGRQLWSSLKMISGLEANLNKVGASTSGGWEFLVDCRRDEATTMLRKRKPGSFIIRPHPDDNGVFTLSFKTNLTPADAEENNEEQNADNRATKNKVKKDDVVQHAVIRLSDAGFRCGSFGPFTTLMKLLEAVSASLPFNLLFDKPPTEGIIKDEETQSSPNSVFLRKFALTSSPDNYRDRWSAEGATPSDNKADDRQEQSSEVAHMRRFGVFSQLLALSEIRKQLSAVAAANYNDLVETNSSSWRETEGEEDGSKDKDSVCSVSVGGTVLGTEERYAVCSRIVRPFLTWCKVFETRSVHEMVPEVEELEQGKEEIEYTSSASEAAIELTPGNVLSPSPSTLGGDSMIRQMIQPESGVEFRTMRVGEGVQSAMIVLFSKNEAIAWLKKSGIENSDEGAIERLGEMEKRRVIETIALSDLHLKAFPHLQTEHEDITCFRFVDPWEVESLSSGESETKSAALGREHYLSFNVSTVSKASEAVFRKLGGLHLLGLWTSSKGGLRVTRAVASALAPWERDDGGDLQMTQGTASEPTAYSNSIRQHLYKNAVFRLLKMPLRFVALVQVELLDLKNLTSAPGTAVSVYALLRLKRHGSNAPLSHKARTLDSAATPPSKIVKSSGPNAPASWGRLARFRFPLPENVNCDGVSLDEDREALFKGPPCILQLSVYEEKFMNDISLGGADIKLDALKSFGQMEEWVPLRSPKVDIKWFTRIRLTLRFEIMRLPSGGDASPMPPSVGLRKIQHLSRIGGTHEDKVKRTASTPDLLSYFESMVY